MDVRLTPRRTAAATLGCLLLAALLLGSGSAGAAPAHRHCGHAPVKTVNGPLELYSLHPGCAPAVGTDDWPGGSGFTAILASRSSEAEAVAVEAEASRRGLDARILYSSDYSSLRPGYWAVFSGLFPDDAGAELRASRAQELGHPDAYPGSVAR